MVVQATICFNRCRPELLRSGIGFHALHLNILQKSSTQKILIIINIQIT